MNYDFPTPVINFTDDACFTRKTQWNLLPNSYGQKNKIKTITYERPCSLEENPGEHYYPVQTKYSRSIYQKYQQLSKEQDNLTFCGRTGLFKYIDMIPAVGIHLNLANKFLNKFLAINQKIKILMVSSSSKLGGGPMLMFSLESLSENLNFFKLAK